MSPDGSTQSVPEEKLLKLIRGKSRSALAAAAPLVSAGETTLLRQETRRKTRTFKILPERFPGRRIPWSRIVILGLGVVLLFEGKWLWEELKQPLRADELLSFEGVSSPLLPQLSISERPSLVESAKRPLFIASATAHELPSTHSPQQGQANADTTAQIHQMAKTLASRLTLLGIVASEPAQVIIEDSQTKKTYFVSLGQEVVEGAILKEVLEHQVILELSGEKITLTL